MARVLSFTGQARGLTSFERAMEPHFAALYNAARRLTGLPDDAEDLVQEVCIKAYRHREDLQELDYPRAWLLRTLYHQFIDSVRRQQRSPVSLALPTDEASVSDTPGPLGWQPEENTERQMTAEAILRAMQRLDSDQGTLLALHDIDGVTLKELAKLTGLPLGTIKSRLHRARIKLGKLLQRDFADATVRFG